MAVQGPHPVMASSLSVPAFSLTPTSTTRHCSTMPLRSTTPTAEVSPTWPSDECSPRSFQRTPRRLNMNFCPQSRPEEKNDTRLPGTPKAGVSPCLWNMLLSARQSSISLDKGINTLRLRDTTNLSRTKLFDDQGDDVQLMDVSSSPPEPCPGSLAGLRSLGELPRESTPLARRCTRSPRSSPECAMGVKRRRLDAPGFSVQLFPDAQPIQDKRLIVRRRSLPSESDRYEREFEVREQLGWGEFGAVFKCQNLVDGALYAVKRSHQAVDLHLYEASLREAHTHGMLESHAHIVRYYSAWLEERRLFMQFEYCSGGSLQEEIARHSDGLSDSDVRNLLLQVARGLQHIHDNQIVHLDIKPGNIFLCRQRSTSTSRVPDTEAVVAACQCCKTPNKVLSTSGDPGARWIYKIGDLGHAVQLDSPDLLQEVDEGDCRYLSREVLEGDFSDLRKADIFALSLTAYEALCGGPLPKNGPQWHQIRKGHLTRLPKVSDELHGLLTDMVRPDFLHRPSAADVVGSSVLCPSPTLSYDQLWMELNKERLENVMLKRQLAEMQREGSPQCSMTLRRLDSKLRSRGNTPRRNSHGNRSMYFRSQSID